MSSIFFAELRLATEADLPLLGDLEARAGERFRESLHGYAADLPSFDPLRLRELWRQGGVWVAVVGDGPPLGFALAGRLGAEHYLHELDVEPAHGRRGIGRALVRRVGEWARASGGTTLLLSTFSDVPWNAPFYAGLGFETVPLAAYTPAMHDQRGADATSMRVASRVMMRVPLQRLLEDRG